MGFRTRRSLANVIIFNNLSFSGVNLFLVSCNLIKITHRENCSFILFIVLFKSRFRLCGYLAFGNMSKNMFSTLEKNSCCRYYVLRFKRNSSKKKFVKRNFTEYLSIRLTISLDVRENFDRKYQPQN